MNDVFISNFMLFQVDIFSCRDLDSRFSAREAAAVKEWREHSTEPIHVMRDHPYHTIGMLGAGWDTDLTRKDARLSWETAWKQMFKDDILYAGRDKHGPDQAILEKYIYLL